ncbi:MAG: acyl-CoA dehydrogenase, partial [Halobacteriovoraceae bacterium]|nr:acyl-CoA dehydrogenase [Halobacteriovoraceae bacterium]
LYENIVDLVLARTPGAPKGTKGLSLFLVPRYKIKEGERESNDVHCSKVEEKMGIHGSATCEMIFGGSGNCEGYLIGKEFSGMENMFLMMNEARLLCGSQGESQGYLAFEQSLQYAKQRTQFTIPIIEHPDVKRMLLKMRAICRGMRAFLFYTARHFDCLDHNKGDKKQLEAQVALLTPVCKSWCTDQGFAVSVDAIQVHGGYGYCTEYGIEQFARDSKIATIYEGTNGIQAIDFLTRKILRDEGGALIFLFKKIEASLKGAPAEWKGEISLIKQSLKQGYAFLQHYADLIKAKKINQMLASSTDFLNFSGNLIIAWLLFEHAVLAKKKEKEDAYYASKIVDFKTFCQYVLVQNSALYSSVFDFKRNDKEMFL